MFLLYFYGLKLWSESLCRVLRLSFLEYAHYFVDSQKHKNERIEKHSLSWFVGSTYGDGTNHGHIRYMVQVQVYLVMASRDLNIRDIKKNSRYLLLHIVILFSDYFCFDYVFGFLLRLYHWNVFIIDINTSK